MSDDPRITELPALLGGTPVRPGPPPDWPVADPEIAQAFARLVESGDWGRYHGPYCDALCVEMARRQEAEFVVLCASGTSAVELALRGLNVGPDDEVILAAYDFKANFQNALVVGATPVLVDVRSDTWQIDETRLAAAVTDRTKALIVSHLHGGLADMAAIRRFADDCGLPIIEDVCQMHGARVQGRIAGAWGDVSVFSFGGSKLLTAGRGGALCTSREEIIQRVRLYTQRGNEAYPLSEMQAAVLLPQLEHLDQRNAIRFETAAQLAARLDSVPGLSMLTTELPDSRPSYYKVGLKYDASAFGGLSRERFAAALRAEGFAVDVGFRSLHRIHARRRFRSAGDLAEAERVDEQVLVLHHPILLEQSPWPDEFAVAVERLRTHAAPLGR